MLAEADQDELYLLEQQFRYTYASPVRRLRHRLLVVPRAVHGTQQRFDHGLSVTGGAARAKPSSGGRGVCQDYPHVMLALCHAAHLLARYVSGHLVGEGGSHAWVEVIIQDQSPAGPARSVAVAFDPTHNRRAGRGYVTVAVGRDYCDVAPTSGTFEGAGPGTLSVHKRLSPAEDAPLVL